MSRIASIIGTAALLALPTAAVAGDLSGTVNDSTALPVAGAQVSIPALGLSTVTDAEGAYRFEGLDAGKHRVAVELADGARQHVQADVPATGETTRNVFLYSPAALAHANEGVNPVEAMLADMLLEQAWQEARELAAQTGQPEQMALPDFTG